MAQSLFKRPLNLQTIENFQWSKFYITGIDALRILNQFFSHGELYVACLQYGRLSALLALNRAIQQRTKFVRYASFEQNKLLKICRYIQGSTQNYYQLREFVDDCKIISVFLPSCSQIFRKLKYYHDPQSKYFHSNHKYSFQKICFISQGKCTTCMSETDEDLCITFGLSSKHNITSNSSYYLNTATENPFCRQYFQPFRNDKLIQTIFSVHLCHFC